jgi:arylsulfatase A-like enzyme
VLKRLDEGKEEGIPFFSAAQLEELRQRQIEAVRYLDGVFEQLFDLVPKNTYITVTADHGELFGEGGYFGHGPIHHEKVLEVPFIEGKIR